MSRKRILVVIIVVMVFASSSFIIWAEIIPPPMKEAMNALDSDENVTVKVGDLIVFQPREMTTDTGLIFYPGARVNPRSYAPAAHEIASNGCIVILVRMPLNFAIFGSNKAMEVMNKFSDVDKWVIGGHSLGGAMASRFAYYHQDEVEGLLLWAAYPASNNNLSESGLHVTVVYGSQDGLATVKKVEASFNELPKSSEKILIKGGNHAHFIWYGEQKGDQPTNITRELQQSQTLEASLKLLNRIQNSK